MKLSTGRIFKRSVHHLNFGLGAGYPLPIKLTQKLLLNSGVNLCAVIGSNCSFAATFILSIESLICDIKKGVSTKVSVDIT